MRNSGLPLIARRAFIGWIALSSSWLVAQPVPPAINYQGRLTDNATTPAPVTATVQMRFALYSAATGGILLWEEPAAPATIPVAVQAGIFNVTLGGNGVALSPGVFDGGGERYLEIIAGGETLLPRQPLSSSGFSMRAAGAFDSAALGGTQAAGWQRRVAGICGIGTSATGVNPDGSLNCAPSPVGPVGPQGPAGPQGPTGPQGPAGASAAAISEMRSPLTEGCHLDVASDSVYCQLANAAPELCQGTYPSVTPYCNGFAVGSACHRFCVDASAVTTIDLAPKLSLASPGKFWAGIDASFVCNSSGTRSVEVTGMMCPAGDCQNPITSLTSSFTSNSLAPARWRAVGGVQFFVACDNAAPNTACGRFLTAPGDVQFQVRVRGLAGVLSPLTCFWLKSTSTPTTTMFQATHTPIQPFATW